MNFRIRMDHNALPKGNCVLSVRKKNHFEAVYMYVQKETKSIKKYKHLEDSDESTECDGYAFGLSCDKVEVDINSVINLFSISYFIFPSPTESSEGDIVRGLSCPYMEVSA